MAGWQIRAHSRDVDLYIPEISADAVKLVEQEFRARRGASFRLHVATGENLRGKLLIRNFALSPVPQNVSTLELRALRIEDLFSLRPKVTTSENTRGQLVIRDTASSPVLGKVSDLELRALRIEDLFLLTLASGQAQDLPDLDLLAPRTTADALVDRWNQLINGHDDRNAILGFADGLVVQLQRLFGCDPVATIARLEITADQRESLLDRYRGKSSK